MVEKSYGWLNNAVERVESKLEIWPELRHGGISQTAGNGEAVPLFETERAISAARLQEKYELDARFAEITKMIRETRQLIEQSIT